MAGQKTLSYLRDREKLIVDQKWAQDWVSDAERDVELPIRAQILERWTQDGCCQTNTNQSLLAP